MKREEIIAMAREAGLIPNYAVHEEDVERFAALVEAKAAAKEREACAKLCEKHQYEFADGGSYARAIRARGAK